MRDETRQWFAQGDKDLGTAGFALKSIDGPLPVTTALHCQQAAEKYFKAYLQEKSVLFSNADSLNSLFASCINIDPSFDGLTADIEQLSGYSIATRYPNADHSLEFRKEAIAAAKRVKEFVASKLG